MRTAASNPWATRSTKLFENSSLNFNVGYCAAKTGRIGAIHRRPKADGKEIRSVPRGSPDACDAASASASAIAKTFGPMRAKSSAPASVSASRLVVRAKSLTPRRCSREETRRDRAVASRSCCTAARVNEPVLATATKATTSSKLDPVGNCCMWSMKVLLATPIIAWPQTIYGGGVARVPRDAFHPIQRKTT